MAMDFWASLEHHVKYKKDIPQAEKMASRLKKCAEVIACTDEEMQKIAQEINLV